MLKSLMAVKWQAVVVMVVMSVVWGVSVSWAGGTKKWEFTAGGAIRQSSPAIGADGTVYVGSDDTYVYAINPDGTQKWRFKTEHEVRSSPAIGADGTIYIGSDDAYLYALNSDGTRKWRFKTLGDVQSSPALAEDGTIYFGSKDYALYAVSPDGDQQWRFVTQSDINSSPAISVDGTIYFGSTDKNLYALNPDGSEKWSIELGGSIYFSSPAIGPDGTVYIGATDGCLYAVNSDGTEKWRYQTVYAHGPEVRSSPAVGPDGTVYVGTADSYLYALNPDGTRKWRFQTDGFVRSSPAVGADGTVYVGSNDRFVYALNSDGTLKWKFDTGAEMYYSSPVIGNDGTVYAGSISDKLYALEDDSGGLAESSWPMFRHNMEHTGRSSAAVVSPSVNAITPNMGMNTGPVNITNLSGSGFKDGAVVTLTKSGEADITASNVVVASDSVIKCTFDISGCVVGKWNIQVTNTDTQSGILNEGFVVSDSSSPTTVPSVGGVGLITMGGLFIIAAITFDNRKRHNR